MRKQRSTTESRSRSGTGTTPRSSGPCSPVPVPRLQSAPPVELVAACLEGESGAWEELLRRYANLIYSTILRSELDATDAEEAFQETAVALYRQLPRLREREKLTAWVIGIARRQAVNRIRARARERRLLGPVDPSLVPSDLPDPVPLAEEQRLRLEHAQQAKEAMGSISERCRRLLHYLFFEDPPPDYREISRRENIPVGSIGPTRVRCLVGLRRFFAERGWLS